MHPDVFVSKWRAAELKERSAAQEHFIDLCHLLDERTPADADPAGKWYCFERGASKTTGGEGWADVWKRGHFGWEYKGKKKDLRRAFSQLQQYAIALENPPLLVVCDLDRFRIHTNWTNTVSVVHDIALDDLHDVDTRQKLKWVLSDPDQLKPGKTRQMLTEEAAGEFAALANRLREAGHDPETVAHFINRLVFCMFAEDINLLPNCMFSRMLEAALPQPDQFEAMASQLFAAMRAGGMVGFEKVAWFNGGLFDDDRALPFDKPAIEMALSAASLDWSEIDPSIVGTLFERGLDPDKRSQLGAHYTDRDKIMMIIEPVINVPLEAEWTAQKRKIEAEIQKADAAKAKRPKTMQEAKRVHAAARRQEETARRKANEIYVGFLEKLRTIRVLDPACGSGNFLYLALLALKDLEHRVNLDAEALGLERQSPSIGPEVLKGIETNHYAAELARVTVWIGEIQWMRRNGFDVSPNPILKPLETIEHGDALLNPDGSETQWPAADIIVGNPPFLGSRKLTPELGKEYVERLRCAYKGKVSRGADLVCYWFAKANELMTRGTVERAGLVATNSISGGASRSVLDAVCGSNELYKAWRDEPWTIEGAAVRVAIVCFCRRRAIEMKSLDGTAVSKITSDLRSLDNGYEVDLTLAKKITENRSVSFQGIVPRSNVKKAIAKKLKLPKASFILKGEIAREYLDDPLNPNGCSNAEVVFPYIVGDDITTRPLNRFIVDFAKLDEDEAALFERPFKYILPVKSHRAVMAQPKAVETWWQHWRSRQDLRNAIKGLDRFIVTPRVAKHRLFVWAVPPTLPDNALVVVARHDDTTFGILQSRFHELWTLRLCTWLGVGNDPRYTPSTTFETFPFPEGLTPNILAADYVDDPRAQAIASAAQKLCELRDNWLNPSGLVKHVPEVVPSFPDRLLPVDDDAAEILKKRTLTNLYNERPAWLDNAHRELDSIVAAAYGWSDNTSDDDALAKLFVLNQERAEPTVRRKAA